MSIYENERLYFEVTGSLLKHVRVHKRAMKDYRARAKSFCERFGSKEYYVTGFGGVMDGIKWGARDKLPDHFRRTPKDKTIIVPVRNTPEGKKLSEEMRSIARPGIEPLLDEVNILPDYFVGRRVLFTNIFKFGKRVVLYCAKDKSLLSKKWKRHPDLKPIPGWEIVKLEEEKGLKALQVA